MSANIQFVKEVVADSISPTFGFVNSTYNIVGTDLDYATNVKFVDKFQNEIESDFTILSSTSIQGTSPLLDASLGVHEVRVVNELGYSTPSQFFTPLAGALFQANEPRRLIQYTYKEITDHLGVNAPIQETNPNNTQGYEIATVQVRALHAASQFVISCELSLENDFWGGAIVALFKDSETSPRKIWNFGMVGLNMGQMATMTYLATAGNKDIQTWRIRLGRTHTSYSSIYLNRNANNVNPYGLDIAKSYFTITEIEGQGVTY